MNEDYEAEMEKAADKLAELARVRLGLDTEKSVASKIFNEVDLSNPKELTGEEKIVGFFKACLVNDHIALKALAEGVAADGGYLVPDEFRDELIKDLADKNVMRKLAKVVPMRRDVMKIPKLGSRPHVRWTSENATKSTTTADFDEKTLTAYKLSAILYTSEELVEDSPMDVVRLIVDLFAEAVGETEEKAFIAGSGTGQPTGLTNCTITSVSCSGNLDFDDIINLIYALPSKYRANAKFLVNNINIRELRKVKDGNNRYIWNDPVAPNQPSTIYGHPVYESSWVPESEIYFGDFKKGYWIGDRRRITITVSNTAGTAWDQDQIGVRVSHRVAGTCVLENAIRKLTSIP